MIKFFIKIWGLSYVLFYISVPEKYGHRLKQLLKEKVPEYYGICNSVEL